MLCKRSKRQLWIDLWIDFRGLGSSPTAKPTHTYDDGDENQASRHRQPDRDFV